MSEGEKVKKAVVALGRILSASRDRPVLERFFTFSLFHFSTLALKLLLS